MKKIYITQILMLFLLFSSSAQDLQNTAIVEEYFAGISEFGFSGTVLIANKDGILFQNAYGVADRASGRKITSGTVLTLASITKLFTAILIKRLEAEGKLNISDPMSLYIKGVPNDKKNITISDLLSHTSGLKRNGVSGGDTNLEATRKAVLENVLQSPLEYEPGTQQEYSNIGYTLLAIIAENIEKMDYELLLYNKILKPLKMFQTGYLIPNYKDLDLAKGYKNDKEIPAVINLPKLDDGLTWNIRGNGGLHSNAFDMYRFYLGLENEEIIKKEEILKMINKPISSLKDSKYYGLGFEVENENGLIDLTHSGGNGYFATDFHWLIDEGLMFFIATNNGEINMGQLSKNLKKIMRGKTINMPPVIKIMDTLQLQKYSGKYQSASGDLMIVKSTDSGLKLIPKSEKGITSIYGQISDGSIEYVEKIGEKSKEIITEEFKGNFKPKYLSMDRSTSNTIENLARYHGYDADVWKKNFGKFKNVEVIATAGSEEHVSVLLKVNFEKGAAAEIFTWRENVLSNVSIFPDWEDFQYSKNFRSVSKENFQSFQINSPITTNINFDFKNESEKPQALLINGLKYSSIRGFNNSK